MNQKTGTGRALGDDPTVGMAFLGSLGGHDAVGSTTIDDGIGFASGFLGCRRVLICDLSRGARSGVQHWRWRALTNPYPLERPLNRLTMTTASTISPNCSKYRSRVTEVVSHARPPTNTFVLVVSGSLTGSCFAIPIPTPTTSDSHEFGLQDSSADPYSASVRMAVHHQQDRTVPIAIMHESTVRAVQACPSLYTV